MSKKVKIKIIKDTGSIDSFKIGEVGEMSIEGAKRYVDSGHAEYVNKTPKKELGEWDNIDPIQEMNKNSEIAERANKHKHKIFVSWAYKATITKDLEKIKVFELLEFIRTGKWKQKVLKIRNEQDKKIRSKLKLGLGYATFGAVLKHRELKKNPENLISSTGLMTLDWDEEYKEEKVKPFFNKICKDPFVYACFRSPSGALKYLIKIPKVKNDAEYKEHYEAARQYYNEKGITLDISGKDINRCCFVSYDPDLYYNPDCETFTGKKETEQHKPQIINKTVSNKPETPSINKIPKHCGLIENEFAKKEIISQNGITKNQYIDPFLANYSNYNNKPQILQAYIQFEGKPASKFNNSEKLGFNCGSLINYCNKAGHKDKLEHCHKCPEYTFFKAEKQKQEIEIPEIIDFNNVDGILEKLKFIDNELLVDQKLTEITKNSDFSKTILKSILKEKRKKPDTEEKNVFAPYTFNITRFGTFFGVTTPTKTGSVYVEIASFKELEKQNRQDYNIYTRKTCITKNTVHCVSLLDSGIQYVADHISNVPELLEKCKHDKKHTISQTDTENFIKIFLEQHEQKVVDKKNVNIYCFQKGKFYEPEQYGCYNEIQIMKGGVRTTNRIPGFVSEQYKEFLEIKPEKEIIKQCVKDLNSIPVNHEDAMIWKGILCKSISMMLKAELLNLGVKFFPIDIIMGDKGTGKTTLNKLLVRGIWNSVARSNTELSGSIGARLDYPNDIRPIVYEEVTQFKPNWIDMLKEGMTRGVFTIKKGNAEGGQKVTQIYQNFFLDTNEFNVNDEAFEQRICFWHKNTKIDGKDNLDIINNVEANIKHVGKHIYDNFVNLDMKSLWDQAQKEVKEIYLMKDIRKNIKFSQIRFGELILAKVLPELFEGVLLNIDEVLDKKSYFLFNKQDMIKDKIKLLCSKISIRNPEGSEYTISNFISGDVSDSSKIQLYDKHGLLVSTGGNICITRKFLPIINNELQGIKKFNSLKEIYAILGVSPKITEYNFGQGVSTLWAINITEIIKEDGTEKEILIS